MFGLGTIINTAAVVVGGLLGIAVKKGIPQRCREILMQACGISTMFIGAGGTLAKMLTFSDGKLVTQGTMLLIFSMILGSLLGALLDIEQHMERLGEFLKRKLHNEGDPHFVEGFVTATLVICIGAMSIVGSIEDGLTGDFSILAAKAVLDFVIVMVFASTLGKGAVFSAIPLFLYQGAITCLAAVCGNFMNTELIDELSYIGSALIFCVGINIGFGKKFSVGNMLPALLVPIVYEIAVSLV